MTTYEHLLKKKRAITLAGFLLAVCALAQAQVHLVKDFNPSPKHSTGDGLTSSEIVEVNGTTYFTAHTHLNGAELWKTDGTENGTMIVKDIYPGPEGSSPRYLTKVNGVLFFSANTNTHGRELWKTDGTTAGTVLVKDLADGLDHDSGNPLNLFNANGTLYFEATGSFGQSLGLMKSDGTADGTVQVPGGVYDIEDWVLADNGIVYFAGTTGVNNRELWKTDGTSAGTEMVIDLHAGDAPSNPHDLTYINGIVYFSAYNGTNQELWKTDGTEAGTSIVKDINGTASGFPSNLINMNGKLYFIARTNDNGSELWTSDGTAGGTEMVIDLDPGTGDGPSFAIDDKNAFVVLNNVLYFIGHSGDNQYKIWKSDGTPGGTQAITDALGNYYSIYNVQLTVCNGSLYFVANGGSAGYDQELWKSDGTENGTHVVKDINVSGSSTPHGFADANGRLYFYANDGHHGFELWKTDGTLASTNMVKDVGAGSEGSYARNLFTFRNTQYFSAFDDTYGQELSTTDGTAAGTGVFKDMTAGGNNTNIYGYLDIDGEIMLMNVRDNTAKYWIWKSDGTEAGTVPVSTQFNDILEFQYANGIVYFTPNDGTQLWKSDLATGQTEMIKDFQPGGGSRSIYRMTNVNGVLFFMADLHDGSGYELWKCDDGTTNGTVLVRNINTEAGQGSFPSNLIAVNNTLFFTATAANGQSELWKSDGTFAGTAIVKDINTDGSNSPMSLASMNGTLYFQGNYDVDGHGTELWKSDGTEDGTVLVKTISETTVMEIADMTQVNNTLYFWADDGAHGVELWKTDGTEDGTTLVKDVTQGPAGTAYEEMSVVGDQLFFISDGTLWKSEGNTCNTVRVTDASQVAVWDISNAAAGDKLFFIGSNATSGDELFYYDLSFVVEGGCEQTITFNAPDAKTYGDAAFEAVASASSGLDVTLESSNPAVATVSGKIITILSAGETVITATQAGDKNYTPAQPVTQTLTVSKKAQAITFAALPAKTPGDATFNPGATASSGLSIHYSSSNLNVATINDNLVAIVGPGTAVITASQGGDMNYAAAANVEQTLTVNKRTQEITFATITEKFLGDEPFSLQATASSGLPVMYTSSNTAVATINGAVVTLVGEGETIITAAQEGNGEYAPAAAATQKLVVKLITAAEVTHDRAVSAYPNPVTDQLVIETQEAAKGSTIRLTDTHGRVMNTQVLQVDAFTHTLNVSNLPAGVYVVQVSAGARVIATKRIVKK